jgi:urea carboxylase
MLRRKPQMPVPAAPRQREILHHSPGDAATPALCCRRAGDDHLLIEYGPLHLDIALRLRVQALHDALVATRESAFIDLTPGIRSLQIHYDPERIREDVVLERVLTADAALGSTAALTVPSRTVHLPLSWDDPSTRKAIEIYMRTVNPDAPWCPWNIEFIRRINGLDSVDEVRRIVFAAEYLVMGLGDVYLGAPVATPVDPRHRLVTTKYNPARTWTPENAVGIGGAYMCIYGMEGPGGYQFVGRTLQVWNTWRQTVDFGAGKPWLLRQFDRIRFFPVSAEELLRIREDFPHGRYQIRCEDGIFDLAAHQRFLAEQAADIAAFTQQRDTAFAAERQRWAQTLATSA